MRSKSLSDSELRAGRADKSPERGSGPSTPLAPFVQSGAVMYSVFFRKSPFQLGRKAILGLSYPGCAPGVSGLPAGPGRGRGGVGWSSPGQVGGEEKQLVSGRRRERET